MLLVYGGIALWLGGIVFFGFGVASQIFKLSPSRDIAGLLNRAFLHRLNIIEFVSAIMLLGGLALHNLRLKGAFYRVPVLMVIIAFTLLCVYALVITPSMNDLILKIPSFDSPPDPALKAQFDTYHALYSTLVRINLFILFVIFVWQTIIFAATRPAEAVSTGPDKS